MSAAEIEAMQEIENSLGGDPAPAQPTSDGAAAMSSAAGASTDTPAPAPPKPRMIITYDQYITLQSLIVMHLSKVEQETGNGLDRDELIDWYLESKEAEIDDVAELDRERELITKMLRKLVKVSSFSGPPRPGSNL